MALADVIKVDFLATSPEARRALRERLTRRPAGAAGGEGRERGDVPRGARAGLHVLSGLLLPAPRDGLAPGHPDLQADLPRFLRELQQPELNYDNLERVIRRDVSLSMRLLRYLNSAAFYWRSKVTSLKSALVLLGERPFRKWASLIAIVGIIGDGPAELALTCLARAYFCESLCRATGRTSLQLDGFLVGMLSAIDALVGRPMSEILQEIAVSREIEEALTTTRRRRSARCARWCCRTNRRCGTTSARWRAGCRCPRPICPTFTANRSSGPSRRCPEPLIAASLTAAADGRWRRRRARRPGGGASGRRRASSGCWRSRSR